MSHPTPPLESLRFGRFELRALEHRLLADGEPVALGGRAFDLLLALVRRAGQLVTRNELIEQVWPGRVVEENNLSVQINALRKVLGGDWLVTVPGRGYRFVAPLQLAATGKAAQPAAARSPRTHLPALQPLLIGRSDDLAALSTLIDQHRLVTVVGAGGMGKTRLAQALLQLRAYTYAQSVCWVELGHIAAPEALALTVAAALELQLPPGDALTHLAQAVRGMQMLVALDNAEHLLEAVATLAQALLDATPGLRLLVTSQAPLRLSSERVLRLGPLAVPQGTLPAQQAQAFGAVRLFCERAAAADHRFVLSDADVPVVIDLCRRLDGLALAIELAAARAPALGPARLLDALTDRLHAFRLNPNRLAPARPQSLRATLQWSVGLLAPQEQQLFRRLGVLAGSAALELVQQLGSDAQDNLLADPWAVVDALDQLIQRSIVEVLNVDDHSPPRYRLLESPRALALEQLALAGEEPQARHRHAQALLQAFEHDGRAMLSGDQDVATWRREGEHAFADVLQALAWACTAADHALALGLAVALLERVPDPWHVDVRNAVRICETLLEIAEGIDARLACRAWLAVNLVHSRGPQRSQEATTRALQRVRGLGLADEDRYTRYATLCDAARVRLAGTQPDQAQALLEEAQALEDPGWPPVRLRELARARAFVAMAQRKPDLTLRHLKQTLSLSLAAGDPSFATRINIADMELAAGDATAAVETGRALVEALEGRRAVGLLQHARLNLAAAHLALQQAHEALELLQAAWHAARSFAGDWSQLAHFLDLLAWLHALEGRHEVAARLVGAAEARYEATQGQRHVNEQRAHDCTLALLRNAFDEPVLTDLRVQGSGLPDAAVVSFGPETAAQLSPRAGPLAPGA
ncbi:MAG: helix-turn-helix transcriptional regulator [Chitinophagaceae bacterium]|nr:helix-turn-helix transcriptional regulator [Rubrivivax sp.]